MEAVLAADCGSTTTKAILLERRNGAFRLASSGEAPTTVESPWEDVTAGLMGAVRQIEQAAGRRLVDEKGIIRPSSGAKAGVDAFVSTSSAGGGLQMMVAGVVQSMTAESAARAALGAGAIVVDVLSADDPAPAYEKVERLRNRRPDMVLLAGGVDGGTVEHVVVLAEIIAAANPRPRLGQDFQLPVVYAGNRDAAQEVQRILAKKVRLFVVPNLRPELDRENLLPTREKIHELFMEHVMAQAPGYGKLVSWTDAPVMPTPAAAGDMIQLVARRSNINVIGVDIGGATTDVFSVFGRAFNRTVSANLGMSYSASNVVASAGCSSIMRWLPYEIGEGELLNMIGNKVLRPTTIPETLKELKAEQALAREALRLALDQHRQFARELSGVQKQRTIGDAFAQQAGPRTLVDLMAADLLIGSGGVLSHAPRRSQAAMMLMDAFLPEGVTALAVDSIFMMPQLGVFASVEPQAAVDVLFADCLVNLGTCIAPVGQAREGEECVKVEIFFADGKRIAEGVSLGDIKVVPVQAGQKAQARIIPARGFDVGAGLGNVVETEIEGAEVGVVLDGRGRPLDLPHDPQKRAEKLKKWSLAVSQYPPEEG